VARSRLSVGSRVSRTAQTGFVLDALEQALHERRPLHRGGLVHHSDRGGQYVSIPYTERLAQAGIEPSVGSVGDSYDNALAESINGLYRAEVIHRRGPWRSLEAV
jgi:transposase InsO family protein